MMQLTCEKRKLEEAVMACARAINPRSPLPILSHLLFEAHDGHVKLTATDAAQWKIFGFSVSIDGDYAIVRGGGSAYIFK